MGIADVLNEETYNSNHASNLSDILALQPIIVFGSGNLGKKIGAFLLSKKYNLVAYSDNNELKWGNTLNGIPVLSPSKAAELYGNNTLFIISIWGPSNHSFAKTKKQLTDLGIKNIAHAAAVMHLFPNDLLPHFHWQTPDYFFQHKQELTKVYNMLADEESKKQFLAHIDCRINLNFEGLPTPDTKNQYFPSDISSLNDHETFLDAGTYDGDTLQDFCDRTAFKFTEYIALEPDPANRTKLQKRVEQLNTGKVSIFPYAVGAENCLLKFKADGSVGAGIAADGTLEVECVKIDDKFYNKKPTFLKFDIEGAELDALIGAEKVIKDLKPVIAVCIYHKPEDLWAIPFKLKEYNKDYKLFVRAHSFDGFEFVLYAMPN